MVEPGRANEGRDFGEAPGEAVWDVFLSYAAEDAEWAKAVESNLTGSGLRVFSSYAAPERFWGRSMDEIISKVFPDECPVAMVALSHAYSSSENCLRELEAIVGATAVGKPALVLPARLDDSPIPETIRSVAALDARGLSADEVARRLALRVEDAKRSTADEPAHVARSASEFKTDSIVELLRVPMELEIARLKKQMPHEDAEDVVHNSILDVLHSLQRPQITDPLAYFKEVIRLKAMGRHRYDKYRPRTEDSCVDRPGTFPSGDSPTSLEQEEEVDRVKSALELLGDKERQIIDLYYMQNMTLAEVARRLDLSRNAVDVRYRRALSKLRDAIEVER